jgi:hypothetical protein
MKKNKTPSEFNYTKSKEEFQLLRERGAFEDDENAFSSMSSFLSKSEIRFPF